MINRFIMNGFLWKIKWTYENDPILIDRTGTHTVAVTDPDSLTVWVSDKLSGSFLTKVILHELGHVSMFSYGIVRELHKIVPKRNWIEIEELICNIIADYAKEIFERAYEIVGDEAIRFVPYVLERGNIYAWES